VKASEFPDALRELKIEGATVGPVVNKDGEPAPAGSGVQHGFLVTGQHGARIAWQVATQEDGLLAGTGPSVAYPSSVPVAPDRLVCADVEASIAHWVGKNLGEHISEMVRYSETRDRGIRYGLRIDLYSGGRVFIQALWILEPGEEPNRDNKYRMRDAV